MNLKQVVLGHAIGRFALSARRTVNMLQVTRWPFEIVGTIANDYVAEFLITKICKPGKTFIDVGTHIGSIVAAVAHNDRSIKIVAIEAIPEKANNLRRKFPAIEIHACAAGEQQGEAAFYVNTRASGYSSLNKPANGNGSFLQEIRVPIRRLDELVSSSGGIDAIKIDVEGAELGVLRGCVKIIDASRPSIMFESVPDENSLGYTKEAMWQFFRELDYVVLIPNRVPHNGAGLTREGFLDSHLYPMRTMNYFAIPSERRLEIRDRARQLLGISTQ